MHVSRPGRSTAPGKSHLPEGRWLLASVLVAGCLCLAAPAVAAASTYYVSPKGSDSVTCATNSSSQPFATVQAALACAASGDTVSLAPSGSTPYPGIGTVSQSVTIEAAPGANARTVQIDLSEPTDTTGELLVAAGATVTVESVGLNCITSGCDKPAVTDDGALTLHGVSVTGSGFGGVLEQTTGASASQLTVLDSTIANNDTFIPSTGAGITLASGTPTPTATIANTTIADNTGPGATGALYVGGLNGDELTLTNDTITGNYGSNVGGIQDDCSGSCPQSPILLSNTIVAGNSGSSGQPDCLGQIGDGTGGHNLIGDNTGCEGFTDDINGDLVGVPNPGLNPLGKYGGPTETASLQPQSPAIGAGAAATCAAAPISNVDQRGIARGSATRGCDIGAYDTAGRGGVAHATWYVSPAGSDSVACAANSKSSPFATIQAALACAGDGDVISLAPSGSTAYPGVGTISHSVSIEAAAGSNARTVRIDVSKPTSSPEPAVVPATGSVAIQDVALECPLESACARPDVLDNGTLRLQGASVIGGGDGGITVAPNGSTDPHLTVLGSSVVHSTNLGNGTGGTDAGGISAENLGAGTGNPTVTVANSTIADNRGSVSGAGGIYVHLYASTPELGGLTLINDTIAGNQGNVGGVDDNACSGSGCPRVGVVASNTVIAANSEVSDGVNADCSGAIGDGPGAHNLLGDGSACTGMTNGANGDQVGTTASPIDPLLAPAAYNGGPTETGPPLAGSPVIGAADPATCEAGPISDLDQRGDARRADTRNACDIGAYDTGGTPPSGSAPAITSGASATATESSPFIFTVRATGTSTPAFTETGNMPSGIGLADNGNGTASLYGTPTTTGTYQFTVTASNGVAPDATQAFTLNVVPLSATSVAPNTIADGVSSFGVTVRGTGFQPGATLSASNSGISFSNVTVKSPTVITAEESATASVPSGSYNLAVNDPGVSATCSGCLSVLPAPTVTSLSPATLGQGASVIVTVNGSNFWPPAKVGFTGPGSGVTGAVTFVGVSSIRVKVTVAPTAAPGAYTLNLTNGDGGTASCSGCLTVVAGPTISSISPSTVSQGETGTFTVTGTGFSPGAKLSGPSGVQFASASVNASGTTITATITVASTAPTGTNLPVTVTNSSRGNYGAATDDGLTINSG
jgi:hypothetical protein